MPGEHSWHAFSQSDTIGGRYALVGLGAQPPVLLNQYHGRKKFERRLSQNDRSLD